jgi:hypothetical protein
MTRCNSNRTTSHLCKSLAILCVYVACAALSSCNLMSIGIPPRHMPSGVGTNIWNIGWGNTWSDYYRPGVSWGSVRDPWNPGFLADLSRLTGPIRFMDWDVVNFSPIIRWSDRIPKNGDHYAFSRIGWTITIDPSIRSYYPEYAPGYSYSLTGVAYEWMIDLCNRTGRDMWVCVPIFADDDYCRNLAALINTLLDPKLKVYVEYANETWNPVFKGFNYHAAMAAALGLPGVPPYEQASAYHTLRSLQIFAIFQDVFGAQATGVDRRLVRTLCSGGNESFCSLAIRNIIYDGTDATDYHHVPFNATYNPRGIRPDVFGLAPYVGVGIDGASSRAIAQFYSDMATTAAHINMFKRYVTDRYDFPLVAYEGGQHVVTNADVFSRNPAIYQAYLTYLDTCRSLGFTMFVHCTLYSLWNATTGWGAKQSVSSPPAEAYKFQALLDWIAANP